MRRAWLAAVVLLTAIACGPAPRAIHFADVGQPTIDIFVATCRWTLWDEMGDAIDEPTLLACLRAAVNGQTVEEWRARLRARPDRDTRIRHGHYGRPPTLGLKGDY